MGSVVSVIALAIGFAVVYRSFLTVKKGECIVTENFVTGACKRLDPGLHFISLFASPRNVEWSFSSYEEGSVAKCSGYRIPTTDLCFDPTVLECTTQDGVTVEVNIVVYFNISNPEKAITGVANVYHAIENVLDTCTYAAVSKMSTSELNTARLQQFIPVDKITKQLSNWGVSVSKIDVQELLPPQEIRDATTKAIAAERKAHATLVKMENEQKQRIMMAETQLSEQRCQHEREKAQANHEAHMKKMKTESKTYARLAEAEAEAKAQRMARETEIDSQEREYKILAQHKDLVPLLQYRMSAQAMSKIGSSDSAKIIFAPNDILTAASQLPIVRSVSISDTQLE